MTHDEAKNNPIGQHLLRFCYCMPSNLPSVDPEGRAGTLPTTDICRIHYALAGIDVPIALMRLDSENLKKEISGRSAITEKIQHDLEASQRQAETLTTEVMRLTTAIGPYCDVENSVAFATKTRQEWSKAVLLLEEWRPIVEAARELIGKNITRPDVYIGSDHGKYKLALALGKLIASAAPGDKGVFCLDHKKVMIDGVCPKCVTSRK